MKACWVRFVSSAAAAFCGCALALASPPSVATEKTENPRMQLISTAFAEGASIPVRYTCDDKGLSPPLRWNGAPAGAKTLVFIADDPDAPRGTWVHWVLYD